MKLHGKTKYASNLMVLGKEWPSGHCQPYVAQAGDGMFRWTKWNWWDWMLPTWWCWYCSFPKCHYSQVHNQQYLLQLSLAFQPSVGLYCSLLSSSLLSPFFAAATWSERQRQRLDEMTPCKYHCIYEKLYKNNISDKISLSFKSVATGTAIPD